MNGFTVIPADSPDKPFAPRRTKASRRKAEPKPPGRPQVLTKLSNLQLAADVASHALLAAQCEFPLTFNSNAPQTPQDKGRLALNFGRGNETPLAYPDPVLRQYLLRLAPLALSDSSASTYPQAMSPRLVPLLLGGCTISQLEELTERTLDLLGFEEDSVNPSLSHAMHLVGFGPEQRHIHFDSVDLRMLYPVPGESPEDHLARVTKIDPKLPNMRFTTNKYGQLKAALRTTEGPFAECVPRIDCYGFELQRKVLQHKWSVMAHTMLAFSKVPEAARVSMCPSLADWMNSTQVTVAGFAEAVRRVFERPWHELDLQGEPKEDVIKVMARLLIHRLSRSVRTAARQPIRMHPRALVGMSLLTGVPTGKFVRFALDDLKRRGETFLTPDSVREAVRLVDESADIFHLATSGWMAEMNGLAARMEAIEHPTRNYFAFRMRQGNAPLTSERGVYQVVGYDRRDQPTYKPRIDVRLIGLSEEI